MTTMATGKVRLLPRVGRHHLPIGKRRRMGIEQTLELVSQLRRSMRQRGWSQARLAEEAGLAENTVSRLMRGEKVRPGSLTAALAALGIEHLSDTPVAREEMADSVKLVMEITERWITALPPSEVDQAARDLTRWIMARMT